MKRWRFLNSGFSDAYTNMAIDEALFRKFYENKITPTLRIYNWKPASLSIGYFQDPDKELNIAKCKNENIPLVRRITGGGTIFHDQELTYSLVCSNKDLGTDDVKNSFKILCSFIISTYKRLGLRPQFAKEANLSKKNPTGFSSFCFASNEEYDILIRGRKIGGNAQRRRKHVVFQHGSIPLKLDMDMILSFLKKPDFRIKDKVISLNDALEKELTFDELKNILIESFNETLSTELTLGNLDTEEKNLANKLKEKKYLTNEWNYYRINKGSKDYVNTNKKTCMVG